MTDDLPLAAEFPAATRDQWRKLVDGVLKGAPFEKRLVAKTYDGLSIAPLYERDPEARPVPARAPGQPWQVMQRADHPDPAAANAQAVLDLENGATGLALVFAGSVGAHGFGLDVTASAVSRVLDGVHLDAGIAVELDLGPDDGPAQHLAALVRARGTAPAATDIRFGLDPLGQIARSGVVPAPWTDIGRDLAARVAALAAAGFRGPFAVADGRIIHDAGGSE